MFISRRGSFLLSMSTAVVCCLILFTMMGCSKKPVELAWVFTSGAPIYSTPAVTRDAIVFGNESGNLTVLDKKGEFQWNYNVSMNIISSPAVKNDMIFFGSVNYTFYALNMMGKEVWKFQAKKPIKSDPLVYEGIVYFTSYDGHVYALHADDKKFVWAFPPLKVSDEGVMEGLPEQPASIGIFSYSSPSISGGVLYVGNLDGYVYAIDIVSGILIWKFKTEDGVTSSPLIDSGIVYIGSNDGNVYAIDAAKGTKIWSFKTGAWVNSSPKLNDGVLYIGSNDKNFYALDPTNGMLKRKFQAKGPVISFPAFYHNFVIVCGGQDDGNVYVLDKNTFKPIFTYKTYGKIEADPVVEGNMLYVASFDKQLYAFKLNAVK